MRQLGRVFGNSYLRPVQRLGADMATVANVLMVCSIWCSAAGSSLAVGLDLYEGNQQSDIEAPRWVTIKCYRAEHHPTRIMSEPG